MSDILFKTEGYVFSYRVAGICIKHGRVLLQKPANDDGFAFPGGHVAFGETNEETLIREFREEIGAEISVGELKWVGELYFRWGDVPCHQSCLYYLVAIEDEETSQDDVFMGQEHLEERPFEMEFHWVPLDIVHDIALYPSNIAQFLGRLGEPVKHFIYRE